jgi:hypothetical protein
MLHIVLWKWAQPNAREVYTAHHINVMTRMLHRNLVGVRYRVICVTDSPFGIECETYPLWDDHNGLANATKFDLPSCYRRLKLYDPATQRALGIQSGDRIMSIDVDTVIVGPLKQMLDAVRPYRFVGWALPGTHHPKVFNGSLQLFTAGDLSDIWTNFNAATSPQQALAAGYLGSDQSWLSMNLVKRERCEGLGFPTVASYPGHIRKMHVLQRDTRIIFFHGKRKPWHSTVLKESPWVARYWRY